MAEWPRDKYDIIYMDPPWPMWGDPNKMAAAGKHYSLMTERELHALPVRSIMNDKSAAFVWATCPRLDVAIRAIENWGLIYRGVAFVWVKTNRAGKIIEGQGIPPTFTKPTTELLLAATPQHRGRPFSILTSAMGQVVLSPRGAHSRG